ncbi:MAG TPA: metalloregulator ArsR/SmtB family transcription factor [Gemmatimonadaceae bacterium]|nr:metalloregulator ArsR/SmtB family transcription factor [Gemmatimonadaceae bacterium]
MVNNQRGLDLVFGALADPTRRAILHRLHGRGPATVTELADLFPVSLPAVSKHLKVLERAGLVRRRVEGRVHRLTLRAGPLEDVADWVSHYRRFWSERMVALEHELVGKRTKRGTRR